MPNYLIKKDESTYVPFSGTSAQADSYAVNFEVYLLNSDNSKSFYKGPTTPTVKVGSQIARFAQDSNGTELGLVGSNNTLSKALSAHAAEHVALGVDTSKYSNNPYGEGLAYGRSLDIKEYGFDLFVDPTATTSSETGSYANPFKSVQTLNTYLTANASSGGIGRRVGIKRGTKQRLTAAWNLAVAGRVDAYPLQFLPYGDAADLPVITGNAIVQNWVKINNSPAIYRSAINPVTGAVWAWESQVYQNGNRAWARNGTSTAVGNGDYTTDPNTRTFAQKLADCIAQGPGTFFFDNGNGVGAVAGSIVLYPKDNENPSLGQVECPIIDKVLQYDSPNVVLRGNTTFLGIAFIGARDNVVQVSGASGSNNLRDIAFDRCLVMGGGVDTGCQSRGAINTTGNDLVLYYGYSDGSRSSGGSVKNCYLAMAVNNAVELNAHDGLLIEGNTMVDISGNSLVEIYSSGSNNIVRYNKAYSDVLGTDRAIGNHSGAWITDLQAVAGGTYNAGVHTASINNQIYMNFLSNPVTAIDISGGGSGGVNLFQHNTIACTYPLGGRLSGGQITSRPIKYRSALAGSSVNFSNNLTFTNINGNGTETVYGVDLYGASSGLPAGDYNVYAIGNGGGHWYARSADGGTDFGSNFTSYKAYLTGKSSTFDANSVACDTFTGGGAWKSADARVGNDGEPLSGLLGNVGTSGLTLGYTRDIKGRPVPAASPYAGCCAYGK